jgi:hypothetical protein
MGFGRRRTLRERIPGAFEQEVKQALDNVGAILKTSCNVV